MGEFVINEVYPKMKGKLNPLSVNFRNGYVKENFGERECVVLEHKVSQKRTIATEVNDVLYVGEESDEPIGKTLLLARNRITGTVRLIEVGLSEIQPTHESDVETAAEETSFVELGRKFGSKKYKQMLEQKEKLKVSEEVVTEQLKDVSLNITQDQLDLTTYNKSDSDDFYIPPIDRDATDVKDIFKLNAILTEEQYETIYAELESSDYVKDLFPCIKEIYSENWTTQQIVLAVYASTLLKLNNMIVKVIAAKNFTACPYSLTLNNLILKEFFVTSNTRSTRGRPAQYKDKALCHAIVFIFLINKYKLVIDSLCKHAKIMERTATMKVNITGAWCTKQGTKKIGVLKLPLNKASGKMRRKSAKF